MTMELSSASQECTYGQKNKENAEKKAEIYKSQYWKIRAVHKDK